MIPLITGILGIGKTWLEGKNKVAQAELTAQLVGIQADSDIRKAKALSVTNRAERGQDQDFDLDKLAMENMEKSWKDELILLVFLAPMIMAFVPSMDKYALAGFAVVAMMPQWYQYIIIGMVVVIYGLRGLLEKFISRKFGDVK